MATPRAEAVKRSAMRAEDMGRHTLSPAEIIILRSEEVRRIMNVCVDDHLRSTSCQYEEVKPISTQAEK